MRLIGATPGLVGNVDFARVNTGLTGDNAALADNFDKADEGTLLVRPLVAVVFKAVDRFEVKRTLVEVASNEIRLLKADFRNPAH